MKTPENIWAKSYGSSKSSGYWNDAPFLPNNPKNVGTEYIRADLIHDLSRKVAAAEKLAEALREILDAGLWYYSALELDMHADGFIGGDALEDLGRSAIAAWEAAQ